MQRHKKRYVKLTVTGFMMTLSLVVGAGIMGCSDSGQQPKPTPAPIKPKQQMITAGTPTVIEQKPQTEYTYHAAGRPDPFTPIIVKEDRKALVGERPPLERYSISEFKLAGIVWGGFGYSAMLEGPDGKGYFVHVGTIIGQNRGKVKTITQHTMVIEEKFKTISGETDRKEIVLELRNKQEGMQ
jgi:type IV pilus assembly protein PilP